MSDQTGIEWTDATWNPVTGCTKVSPGCDHCYAETFAERWRGTSGHHFEQGFDVRLWPDRLGIPLRWKKPRRIFVNSMSDLFHESIPDEYITQVFATMALASQHTFQVLTKRHARMRSLLRNWRFYETVAECATGLITNTRPLVKEPRDGWTLRNTPGGVMRSQWQPPAWPLPNVWLGVSTEDQKWADIRIPALLDTPAAVHFLSCEPLIGPVSLKGSQLPGWVIVGGESGPGARPMDTFWARHIVNQCTETGTPVFVKQMGSVWAREHGCAGKGGDWDSWPGDLRVREFPAAATQPEAGGDGKP